ncbi:hypothetical protein [Providencia sp. PROV230]|uniref:hypothetical protein n=1 Tax=Providencia sp. PROV230 TaxID=2949922 RepID=UPI00234AD747|nr:hypothetical protein [Providencia sp. PROV230]
MDKRIEKINEFIEKFKPKFSGVFGEEITDWYLIKDIITFFMDNDEGSPIVDFIDISNWDSVESYRFNDLSRHIEMIWHNFKPDVDELEINVFGANKITCEIYIDSIVILQNKGIPVVLIKGFYKPKNEINKIYNTRCSDFSLTSFHPFSREIIKIVRREKHIITLPNINLFTTLLVPNCARFINPSDSKNIMYDYNFKLVCDKITNLLDIIVKTENQDELREKGNSVRRNFENALKILNLRAGVNFDDDYQKLMLGSLIAILTDFEAVAPIDMSLQEVVEVLNGCSHDSGVYINKDELVKATMFIIGAIIINNKNCSL